MNKKLRRMESGSVALPRFLTLIIVIIAVSMLTVSYAGYIRIMNYKDDISLIVRKYLIRMETYGYLVSEDKESLLNELQELGIEKIDLSGTTVSEVDYGDIIYISIKGELTVKVFNITQLFTSHWGEETIYIDEYKSSTSQQ